MSRTIVGCVVLGMSALSFTAEARELGRNRVTTCMGIVISSTPATATRGWAREFSAARILDLNPKILFPSERHPASIKNLELRYYTPHGHLYQKVPVVVASEDARAYDKQRFRQPQARVRSYGRAGVVEAPPLMVAGTLITLHSLYGEWRLEAWPEGASRACSTTFVIGE